MTKQISKRAARRKKAQQKIPFWPFGLGFTLLIAALFFIPQKENSAPLPQEPSSIPAEVNYRRARTGAGKPERRDRVAGRFSRQGDARQQLGDVVSALQSGTAHAGGVL